jgi:hypothetical protein
MHTRKTRKHLPHYCSDLEFWKLVLAERAYKVSLFDNCTEILPLCELHNQVNLAGRINNVEKNWNAWVVHPLQTANFPLDGLFSSFCSFFKFVKDFNSN